MIIAVDGPAAAGKGSLCRHLGGTLNLPCLDTGLLYRIVAMDLLLAGKRITDTGAAVAAAEALDIHRHDEQALRAKHMGEAASVVSAIPELRAALLDFQRNFAGQPGGAVLDGRDIGTVICPGADLKFFVTATPEVRADRRHRELLRRGETVQYDEVLADIRRRDERDSSRSSAPLTVAPDAIVLDTSHLTLDQVIAVAMVHVATIDPDQRVRVLA